MKTSKTKTTTTMVTTTTISSTSLLVGTTLPVGVDVVKASENFLISDEKEANFSQTRIIRSTYTKPTMTTITSMNSSSKENTVVTTTVTSMNTSLAESKSIDDSSVESKVVKVARQNIKHTSIKSYSAYLGVFEDSMPKLIKLQKLLKQRLELNNSDTAELIRDYCIYLHLGFADKATEEEVKRGRKAIKSVNQAMSMRVLLTNEKDTESEEIGALINRIHKEAFPNKNPNKLVEALTNKYSTRKGSRKKRKSILNS